MSTPWKRFLTTFYTLAWIWVGSFVFRNVFTGIMVNNFLDIRKDLTWDKQETKAKFEVILRILKCEFEIFRLFKVSGVYSTSNMLSKK